jgi:hypothetical protein
MGVLQAEGWLTLDSVMMLIPFGGPASHSFQLITVGYRVTVTAEVASQIRSGVSAGYGLAHFLSSLWNVDAYKDQPSPRPDDQAHHGVMSAWMKAHYPNYNPDDAPTVLMPNENHYKTFDVYQKWRTEWQEANGEFDWTKVTESQMRDLGNKMFDAAGVPGSAQEEYWQWFARYKAALSK